MLLITELQAEIKVTESRLFALKQSLHAAKRTAIVKKLGDKCPARIFISDWWDCAESPTGKCVYDQDEDSMHDDCIFCHDPEERQ